MNIITLRLARPNDFYAMLEMQSVGANLDVIGGESDIADFSTLFRVIDGSQGHMILASYPQWRPWWARFKSWEVRKLPLALIIGHAMRST